MEKLLTSLLGVEEETTKAPVSIVNGKWSLYGESMDKLDQEDRDIVFGVIIKAINVDQDRTNSLKF